jgi:outer membrane protein TolC
VRTPALALLAALVAAAPACRRFTKEGADREVHSELARRRPCVPELAGTLDVDAPEGPAGAVRRAPPERLSLDEALAVATRASREYRTEREDVYLAALALTDEVNAFRPQWAWPISTRLAFDREGVSASFDQTPTVSKLFQAGGSAVLSLATTVLRNLGRLNPIDVAQSILSSELVLPLARGASRAVVREPLTQAEHDVLYALRDYARFQQRFSVDVASAYWDVLEAEATAGIEEESLRSLEVLLERQREYARSGGRIPEFQVDQAEQDLLRAEQRVLAARAAYERALDGFKETLGVPPDAPLALTDDLLATLESRDATLPVASAEAAVATALGRRLDLLNAAGREHDAVRQARVAKDALRPDVALVLGGDVSSSEGRALDFLDPDAAGSAGVDVDLPLERTAERNAYRSALIQANRARRDREATEDRVRSEVRDAWRRLELAAASRRIQGEGRELAERRVAATTELLAAGRAEVRDRLEAEEARTQARSAYVSAVVEHAVARLQLLRDMGSLWVDERGAWSAGPRTPVAPLAPPAAAPSPCPPPPPPLQPG